MMINFSAPITDFDENTIPEGVAEDGKQPKPFTLGAAAIRALVSPLENERPPNVPSPEEKFKRADLAHSIHHAGEGGLELKVEEVAMIKKLIGLAFPALIVYRAWKLLDVAENKPT